MKKRELKLAAKLWGEIRNSLLLCGDIGEFSPKDFEYSDIPRVTFNNKPVLPLSLLARLEDLDVEVNEVFWNVYEALAIGAAKRLGFEGKMAIVFADSLTCVRTHMVGGHRTEAEQCISQEIFLREVPLDSEWDPNSIQIRKQNLLIYNKIKKWQLDPILYEEEIGRFWKERNAW
jgi:hypothetical protein